MSVEETSRLAAAIYPAIDHALRAQSLARSPENFTKIVCALTHVLASYAKHGALANVRDQVDAILSFEGFPRDEGFDPLVLGGTHAGNAGIKRR